jgi:hypothetical protein
MPSDVTCPYFRARREDGETTIKATCIPATSGEPVRIWFDVHSVLWRGNIGGGLDHCQQRKEIRDSTIFSCTVRHTLGTAR